MKGATRAHTVPQFYLRGFVAPESEAGIDPFVWIGSLPTGEVKRRSPKNISIIRGLYDGPGGFDDLGASIEGHLAKIEGAASSAIHKFVATEHEGGSTVPAEIWRFLAWQAARTPGWMELEEEWVYDWDPNMDTPVLEPPPEGISGIRDKVRKYCLEDPDTGELREVMDFDQVLRPIANEVGSGCFVQKTMTGVAPHAGVVLSGSAFSTPLLGSVKCARRDAWFITSGPGELRGWLTATRTHLPVRLRHPTAQIVAPLTRKVALVGRNETQKLQVTPSRGEPIHRIRSLTVGRQALPRKV